MSSLWCAVTLLLLAAPDAAANPAPFRPLAAREGVQSTFVWRVRLPATLPAGAHHLGAWSADGGAPLMALEATGADIRFVTAQPAPQVHWSARDRLKPAKLYEIVMRVRWSRDPARGSAEVWIDGDKQVDRAVAATLPASGTPVLSVGAAGEGAVREGKTLADVTPPYDPGAPGQIHRDVTFARAGGEPLTLDAFVPDGKGPFPTVIIVHGGGFVRGDKTSYVRPMFAPLSRAGFAWFTVNYRLAPRHKYPAAVDDVERAIRWVKANARKYRVDTGRIALLGESAGGYLVSLIGTRRRQGGDLAAVIPFYAVHDFALPAAGQPPRGALPEFFGVTDRGPKAEALLRAASPLQQAKRGMPPFLLVHSTDDPQVPYQQSVRMCARIQEVGSSCDLFTMEGMGHGTGKWKDSAAEQERLVGWLQRTLRITPTTARN